MCFGDWRIGRLIRSIYHYADDAESAGGITLRQNSQRVGITLMCEEQSVPAGGGVSMFDATTARAVGFIPYENGYVHITLATHGDLPTRALQFIPVGGTSPALSAIEYIAPESMLTAALEEFQRCYPGAM